MTTLKPHSSHGHTHGAVDPSLFATEKGLRALKWSLGALMATALLQVGVVYFTGSVALLADTIHNFGDALTAVPLWVAFRLASRPASRRFTYGYGRMEDLAGLFILLMILISAAVAGYESFQRLFEPAEVRYLWAVAAASVIGFIGNEAVALHRIRVGKEIGSAALVADGHHARVDGLTSLAVLAGAIGVWLGYPLADPLVGLLITVAILKILWDSSKSIFQRLLDGVDPEVIDELEHAAGHVNGVREVSEAKVRWLGHRMHAELNLTVDRGLTVEQGHDVARAVQGALLEHLPYLSSATIHIDPVGAAGSNHHPQPGDQAEHEHHEAHEHEPAGQHGHEG
jgi:cation diffusion facilitator family transporter